MQNEKITWPGWETVRLIGQGSFGAVYEIQRKLFEDDEPEKAALKVISIPQNDSDIEEMYNDGYDEESVTSTFHAHLKSIVAEYSLMRKMNGSSNIVNCDDVRYVQHDDGIGWDIYIKMELLTPLAKALPAAVSEAQVTTIARDMCTALALCSKHNIVHRDIKPQNIFVSPHGDYKLGDFGIAKTVEKTMGGTKTGTYKYMAPEVYNNRPYGSAADIYSLGLVLYWLLNERRMPFMPLPPAKLMAGMDEDARQRRLSGEKLPEPAHGSAALKKIVLKACAFDPKDRYQSAAAMLEDLNSLDGSAALEILTPAPNNPIEADEKTTGPAFTGKKNPPAEEDLTEGTVGPVFTPKKETPKAEEAPTEGTVGPVFEEKKPQQLHTAVPEETKGSPAKRKNKWWLFAIACVALCAVLLYFLPGFVADKPVSTDVPKAPEVPQVTEAAQMLYIPVIAKGEQHQFWQTVKAGAEAAAKDLGVQIYFDGPASEVEIKAQVDMIAQEMTKNPDALVLAALDSTAVADILADCASKNIPVIGFDSGVPGDISGAVKATACPNNEAAAAIAAEKFGEHADLVAKMKAATTKKPIVIAVLSQDAVSASITGRTTGFVNKMKEVAAQYGTVAVTGHSRWAEGDAEAASIIIEVAVSATTADVDIAIAAKSLLAKKNLAAVFCSNEVAVTGFLSNVSGGEDLANGGKYADLVVAGFDAGAAQKNAVRNGWFYGSVTQNPYRMGYYAVEMAVTSAKGGTVTDRDTGAKWYDASNIDNEDIAMLVYD